ncbi:hypothetical protein [Rhodanobacter sp. FW106-PBR-R2A-1-13]|uniref:hypothetical protein n=1 Tax=Rhodanobacter sp. FW106-PBR-R2A-1-13 TaxID=3454845 RepID=UPI0034E40650
MHDHGDAHDELREKLLGMIDWTQRTGWPTRAHDTAVATRVFDEWWLLTDPVSRRGGTRNRRVLLDALAAVLSATHDAEAVAHLCAMFAVVFESQIRSREGAANGEE